MGKPDKPKFRLPALVDLADWHHTADFLMLDKYQGFSAELLRLAMAGIAAIGALLALDNDSVIGTLIQERGSDPWQSVATLLGLTLVAFGLAIGSALLHRVVSSISMADHITLMKLEAKRDRLVQDYGRKWEERYEGARRERDTNFRLSDISLGCGAAFLGLGAVIAGMAIYSLLGNWQPPLTARELCIHFIKIAVLVILYFIPRSYAGIMMKALRTWLEKHDALPKPDAEKTEA